MSWVGIDPAPTHPAPDEFEISLFGRGIGECVVAHIGDGDWVVVDSCVGLKHAVALEYLAELNVDVAQRVRLVVVSHWHDDHSDGISDVIATATASEVAFSNALTSLEFVTVVKAYSRDPLLAGSSGVDELEKTYEILRHRGRARRVRGVTAGPKFTGPDKRIFLRAPSSTAGAVEIWSLSPSDAAAQAFLHEIAEWAKPSRKPKRRLVVQEPNTLASVIWIDFAGRAVLLGSDLEIASNPALGWLAIVNSAARPQTTASVFKVPHHGSKNGHEPLVWSRLVQHPISILTPFTSSQLPRPQDAARVRAHSNAAYIAAQPSRRPLMPRDPAVAKTLREQQRKIWSRTTKLGQVRVRWGMNAAPRVDLFGAAAPL